PVLRYFITLLFFFKETAITEIYTLSLHDALPILDIRQDSSILRKAHQLVREQTYPAELVKDRFDELPEQEKNDSLQFKETKLSLDRKSTRLNSSHVKNSYAVFCLKKKRTHNQTEP